MASITFPYREEQSKIFGGIYRPVARVKFKFGGEWIPEWMYVDSGADITLIRKLSKNWGLIFHRWGF